MTQMTVLQPGAPFPSLTVALPGGSTLRLPYSVVALSVDDEATTGDLIAGHGLRFPVGHSADAAAVAHATGAFVNPDPPYLQSTGFVLDPGGRVIVSVYSSGAIGRLIPQDVAGLAGYLREHPRPARSRRYGNSDPR